MHAYATDPIRSFSPGFYNHQVIFWKKVKSFRLL